METENTALRRKQEEYFQRADGLFKEYLQEDKKGLLVLSTHGWGLSVPTRADYTRRLLEKLPEEDRTLLKARGEDQAWHLHFNTKFVHPLRMKMEVQWEDETLYELTKEDWEERHVINPTKNPHIYLHRLESFSPLDDYGGKGEFFTVNMPLEQIKKISQEASNS